MPTLQEIKKRQQYITKANQTEEKYGLPKNLLVGVMGAESNFNPNAVSPVGAKGLMQLMKATAQEYGINPLNPSESIDAAGKYLASSYKKFGNWEDSLRSYNMGVGGLQKVKAGKMKMPKETQDYVGRVYKNAGIKYEEPSYANSVAPYMNQQKETVTASIHNFDFLPQNTTFASVPDSVRKDETKTEETDKDIAEVEQKTKEFNFLDELNTTAAAFKLREKQQIEAPQTDYMQQYEQISQFIDEPLVAQQGLTWQEKLANRPKKPTVAEIIAEGDARKTQQKTQVDNTQVSNYNNARLFNPNVRNKTDKEIAQEREAKIQASVEAQKTPYTRENWRQQLASETAATGDKLRVSNEPNFFDDYINPAAMIGNMASNLGQAPLQAQQQDSYMPYVTSIGTPLAVGAMAGLGTNGSTGQFVNNLANPLAGLGLKDKALDAFRIGKEVIQNPKVFLKEASENITDNVIEPVLQRKDRREITKIFNSKIDELNNPQSIQKLEEAGIDSSLFLQDLKKTKLNFTKKGSSMFKIDDYAPTLNFDINQAKKLRKEGYNLSNESIVDHEIGHLMQPVEFRNQKGVNDLISIGELKSAGSTPTAIDLESDILLKDTNTTLDDFSEHNKKYFNDAYKPTLSRNPIKGTAEYWQKTERLPFLRETKRELIDAGFIKDINSEVTPKILKEFKNNTKGNRILSFLPHREESFINLSDLLNKTPALAPIAGASYLATQGQEQNPPQYQQGGQQKFTENELAFLSEIAIKDNNGYWNKNNQGKVVEIDGGNITMKGVDQDIIGISKQTGEKKIMKPNKNYTFSNTKSVIEIPFFKK